MTGLFAHAPSAVARHRWAAGDSIAAHGPLALDADTATALGRGRGNLDDSASIASRLTRPDAILAFVTADGRKTVLDAALTNPHATAKVLGDLLRKYPGRKGQAVERAYWRLSRIGTPDTIVGLEDLLPATPGAVYAAHLRQGRPAGDLPAPYALVHGTVTLADAELILEELFPTATFPEVVGGTDDPEWVGLWLRFAARHLAAGHASALDNLPHEWQGGSTSAPRQPLPDLKNDTLSAVRWSQLQPLNADEISQGLPAFSDGRAGIYVEATADVLRAIARQDRPAGRYLFVEVPGTDAAEEAADYLRCEYPTTLGLPQLYRALEMLGAREGNRPLPTDLPELLADIARTRLNAGLPLNGIFNHVWHMPRIPDAITDAQTTFINSAPLNRLKDALVAGSLDTLRPVIEALAERLLRERLTGEDRDMARAVLAMHTHEERERLLSYRDSNLLPLVTMAGPTTILNMISTGVPHGGFTLPELLAHNRKAMVEEVLPAWLTQWPDLAGHTAIKIAHQPGLLAELLPEGSVSGDAAHAVLSERTRIPGQAELTDFAHTRLGDDIPAWELLDTLLADGWSGSFNDAISTAAELAGEDAAA